MAYLTKCSLCGRDVSSECNSCPGCGHNVASDVRRKEFEMSPVENRIVGRWETDDNSGMPLTIYSDSTFVHWFFGGGGEVRFRGRYSISGDRFIITSYWSASLEKEITPKQVKFSLKGDTLLWTELDENKTYAYKRR